MRRVLLVSPHFPPDSTAATHRVRLVAPHLEALGWEPTVLTVDPRDYEGPLDPALAASVPSSLRVVRVRAWPAQTTRALGLGDLGLRAYTGLRRAALDLTTRERFDAVFITIYPTYPALLGPSLKKRSGIAFVLDYQDPWVGAWGDSVGGGAGGRVDAKSRWSRRLAAVLEPRALAAADGVTAVSQETIDQALARTPSAQPVATAELPIGHDCRDFTFVDRARRRLPGSGDDGLVHLSYVGTLLPTGYDTLRAVFQAIARLRQDGSSVARLRLHFFGTSNQRAADAPPSVLPIATEYGLTDIVTEAPARLDYFEALRVLVDSTAILLLGSRERHYSPSKLYPSLLAGRPVLGFYHAASPASALLQQYGRPPSVRLVTYDDAHPVGERVPQIERQLRELLDHPTYDGASVNDAMLEPSSAAAVAGRLAGVLDRAADRRASIHT